MLLMWLFIQIKNTNHDSGKCIYIKLIFITRDSEVIMFSPCVFVCLCVCVYVCHDVCPDDLTMTDWCHTNYILQVHCWGCLVVQVMFHTLMTSLMTSQGHKVGQIFKLIYLRQYFSWIFCSTIVLYSDNPSSSHIQRYILVAYWIHFIQ